MQFESMNLSFLGTEWFYASLMFGFGVYTWNKQKKESLKQEDLQLKEKIIENNLMLKAELRHNSTKLASFQGDSKEIFLKDISQIKDDDVRVCMFNIIDILQDVFYCYEARSEKINSSLWKNTFYYFFNPVKMPAFVSAYEKYKSQQNFSKTFVSYVDNIIKQQSKF